MRCFHLKNWLEGLLNSRFFTIFFFMLFWKTCNLKALWGNVTLFCRVEGFLFMDLPGTLGPGSSPPALWFFLPSFETRPGPPVVHWTPHQTARKETQVCLRAHNKHVYTDVNTHRLVSGTVSPENSHRAHQQTPKHAVLHSLADFYS